MTIKSRIALGIAALLVVIAMLGGSAVYFFSEIADLTEEVSNNDFQRMALSESLLNDIQQLETQLVADLTQPDERFRTHVQRFAERLKVSVDTLLDDELTAVELSIAEQLHADALNLGNSTQLDTTPLLRLQTTVSRLDGISTRLQSIFEHHQNSVRERLEDSRDLTMLALQTLTILLTVCVVFTLGVLVWLPRYVTAPIARFGESIKRIASGEFRTRLSVERGDEFGKLAGSFNAMAERLEAGSDASQAAVVESRERLAALVDQLDQMILGMDAERKIVYINASMARYLQLEAADALGQYMPDLALGRPRIQQLFEPIALGQSAAIAPFTVEDVGVGVRYLQERVVRLQSGTPSSMGEYIILLSDVTDYEEGKHKQTDYLATLSHEMKTPIASITMSIGLLEDERLGVLDADQLELTQTVRHNANRLLRMVNEVLQLAKTEAGATALSLEQVDIVTLLESAKTDVTAQLRDRQVTLELVAPSEPYGIEADAQRITWVLNNLYSNAIRYSPLGGEIVVAVQFVTGGVRIEVCDQGPGVKPSEQQRIFGRYARAREDKTEGTGLGLAISREYVEAHGGRLFIDPNYGPGACFVLELPRRLSTPMRERAIAADA